jgi:hypothetical protein
LNTHSTVLLVLVALSSAACGKSDPPPNTPPNGMNGTTAGGIPGADQGTGMAGQPGTQPGMPGAQPGMPGTQPGMPGTQPAPGTVPGQPAPAQPAAGTGTATMMDPNSAAMASTVIANVGMTEAPGAAKEGNTMAAQFQQGQTLELAFTMQPGKCYTAIASGMGMTQLDLTASLVTPLPGLNSAFGNATSKAGLGGPQVVLGPKDKCLKLAFSPIAAQAKIVLTSTKGAGMAAMQLFVK